MKLFAHVGVFASMCSIGVSGINLHFLQRNGTNGSKGKDQDNFQDELIDQADPEFKMYSRGDDCISWDDMVHVVMQQCQKCSRKEKKQIIKREMERIHSAFVEADENKDECVDKKEFKKAHEFEGTAPEKPENAKEQNADDFELMDRNNDEMISESEAMHFCEENMPHADLDYSEFKKMFDSADADKDGFVSRKEFDKAGERYEGDGSEVPPPAPPKNSSNSSNHTNTTDGEKDEKKPGLFFLMHPRFGASVHLAIEKMKVKLGEMKA